MGIKIVVGIPSFNEADSIQNVTEIIDAGIVALFDPDECTIINVDNGSADDTKSVFLETRTRCSKHYIDTGREERGKGKNLLKLFEHSRSVGAEFIATFDADLLTTEPSWVSKLLKPIIDDQCDYTTPLYSRNRFEGSITNHLAMPLIYANFGVIIRQPIGGEFAMNQWMADYLLSQSTSSATFTYGIDIFMTMHAVGGGFRVGEVFLGKKFHKPSFPKTIPMYSQVSQSALECIRYYTKKTKLVSYIDLGPESCAGTDEKAMFPQKERALILAADTAEEFKRDEKYYSFFLGDFFPVVERNLSGPTLRFSSEEWAEVLYRFVSKFVITDISFYQENCGNFLARMLISRVVPFWFEIENLSASEVESRIMKQAEIIRKKFTKSPIMMI